MRVLKVGGNELADADFLNGLAAVVAALDEQMVIVHGGGRAITDLSTQLGLPVRRVDGLRVTSARSMMVTEMVLSGQSNKIVVRALLTGGVRAVGISGVDGGLLAAEKKIHPVRDLGYVGTVVGVNTTVLQALLTAGLTPVVSPISLGSDGHSYNVNADEAATAIAAALGATQLGFISNVPGVLHDDAVIPTLTQPETERLITDGVISGGMIPKVKSALEAVEKGVARARITNLGGLQTGGGTVFTQ